jgi:hypothetical protein
MVRFRPDFGPWHLSHSGLLCPQISENHRCEARREILPPIICSGFLFFPPMRKPGRVLVWRRLPHLVRRFSAATSPTPANFHRFAIQNNLDLR